MQMYSQIIGVDEWDKPILKIEKNCIFVLLDNKVKRYASCWLPSTLNPRAENVLKNEKLT